MPPPAIRTGIKIAVMCQLLGLNCATPTDASFSFTGFCQRGGDTDHHADGWGIAFFEGKGLRLFVDHASAAQSPMATFLQRLPAQEPQHHCPRAQGHHRRGDAGKRPPLRARALGPALGVRPQRRPERLLAPPAQPLSPGRHHRQRARLLLADAGAGQVARRPAQRRRAHPHPARTGAAGAPRSAPSTSCSPTARRCGPTAAPSCTTWCASTRLPRPR